MQFSTAVRRLGCTAVIMASGLAAMAGSAHAATFTPTNTEEFVAALDAANASVGVPDRIILATSAFLYQPEFAVTITDDLTIESPPGERTVQAGSLNGAAQIDLSSPFVIVSEGVNATLRGITIAQGGFAEAPSISVLGDVTLENVTIVGSNGDAIVTDQFAASPSVTMINSTISGNNRAGLFGSPNSTLNLTNVTVANNPFGGVGIDGAATIRNSIIATNGIANCYGNSLPGVGVSISYTTDANIDATPGGDCVFFDPAGVGNITAAANTPAAVGLATTLSSNGGPTRTRALVATSPSRNTANNAFCNQVDQRFFVRSDGQCDRGAFELNATPVTPDTTAPSCRVTRTQYDPAPAQQDVTVEDFGSGVAAITAVSITNGTVSVPTFTGGDERVVVTATKTNQAATTVWSFVATDVAGNSRLCV